MTITEQKAFLRSYTGQAQAPADFAQRWQETAACLCMLIWHWRT